jgi:hypothetical protein
VRFRESGQDEDTTKPAEIGMGGTWRFVSGVRSSAPLIVASAIPIIRMLRYSPWGEINYCSWYGAYWWLKKRRQKEGGGAGATVALVPIATRLPATAPVRRLWLRGRGP